MTTFSVTNSTPNPQTITDPQIGGTFSTVIAPNSTSTFSVDSDLGARLITSLSELASQGFISYISVPDSTIPSQLITDNTLLKVYNQGTLQNTYQENNPTAGQGYSDLGLGPVIPTPSGGGSGGGGGGGISLSDNTPQDVTSGSASPGTGTLGSRDDHIHHLSFSTVNTVLGAANASISVNNEKIVNVLDPTSAQDAATKNYVDTRGTSFGTPSVPIESDAASATAGSATTAIRTDAQQVAATAIPGTVVKSDATTASKGTSTNLLRSDAGLIVQTATPSTNVLSDASTANQGTSQFVLRADARLVATTAVPGTTVKSDAASASQGTATTLLRSDAGLVLSTAAPVDIGTTNSQGTSTSSVRADHVHNLPFSAVQTALGAATGAISVNNENITNLLDPVNSQDAVTRNYIDLKSYKNACRAATAAALPSYTFLTGTITEVGNGALPAIDGITLLVNDRVLFLNGTSTSHNGLYSVTQVGDGSHPFILTRTTDADTSAKVTAGIFTVVAEGATNGTQVWCLTTDNPITLNTTGLLFASIIGSSATVTFSRVQTALGVATSAVSFNNQNITNVADPVNAQDATTKNYVDTNSGVRKPVRAATITTLPAYTFSADALTGTSNGALSAQDGVTLVVNDRLLVKNETGTNQKYHGPYSLTQVGDGSHPYILTRVGDFSSSAQAVEGVAYGVAEGTVNAKTTWMMTTASVTLDTTNQTWKQVNATPRVFQFVPQLYLVPPSPGQPGNTAYHVGSRNIPAGTYTVTGEIGCVVPTDTITIQFKLQSNPATILTTLTATQALGTFTAGSTVTVSAGAIYEVYISTNDVAGQGICRFLQFDSR